MATLIHFDKDDEFDEYDFETMGIGIGHKDDFLEDPFEGMGIGIGHRDDKENVTDTETWLEGDKVMLENCPYCGRPAEVFIGPEMSDTSKVHKIRCSYLHCLTIEQTLSGWSPDHNSEVNKMKEDWNTAVKAILRKRQSDEASNKA